MIGDKTPELVETPYAGEEEPDSGDKTRGISDEVTAYTHGTMEYPLVMIKGADVTAGYKAHALKSILSTDNTEATKYHVYIELGTDEVYGIGRVSADRLRLLIDLCGIDFIEAKLKEESNRVLTGRFVYALCI